MRNRDLDPATTGDRALEREMALVDSAVEMVAAGHATRMQLGGLAFGDALLDHARRVGPPKGVRVTPHWGVGEQGLALVFEPADAQADPADAQADAAANEAVDAPAEAPEWARHG